MIRRIAVFALAALIATPLAWADERAPVKIGVLAFRGGEDALKRWSPTADYLSAAIPSARFEVVPLEPEELNAAVETGALDVQYLPAER